MAALLVLALATAPLGGCSWSWQLGSLLPDDGDLTTGSIKPREVDPHHTLNIPWQDKENALKALQGIGANIEKVRPHRDSDNFSINVFDPDGNRWELSFAKGN